MCEAILASWLHPNLEDDQVGREYFHLSYLLSLLWCWSLIFIVYDEDDCDSATAALFPVGS